MKKVYYIFTALTFALVAASCAKQDTVYKEWVKEGGYIYPAKPLNVEAQRGYKRIVVQWTLPMDPSIRTAKLFWDSYTFEKEFNYADYPDGVVQAVIDGLEDRSYTFDIVNFDAEGNRSLAAEITASPFAESWLVSHAERSMKFAEMEGTRARIQMGKATDEVAVTKFRYVNTSGQTVESKAYLTSDKDEIILPDAKKWEYFEYQSAYCPAGGIDTVWTSNWIKSPTPIASNVDASTATVTVTSNQIRDEFKPSFILDGIKDDGNSRWFSSNAAAYRGKFPKILLIDTKLSGNSAQTFNHFIFYQDPDPDGQTRHYIRSVNIYVSDTKFNVDDANAVSNFGNPVISASLNQNDPVQDFVPASPKAGRYIAIVFRNSYNSTGFIDLWEFEAFGYVEPKD